LLEPRGPKAMSGPLIGVTYVYSNSALLRALACLLRQRTAGSPKAELSAPSPVLLALPAFAKSPAPETARHGGKSVARAGKDPPLQYMPMVIPISLSAVCPTAS